MATTADASITTNELREAFKRSGLWRMGWTYKRAIESNCVFISLRIAVRAMRKEQQQYGKLAPIQRALI